MSQTEALAGFVAKWRTRWPEWNIARVFVAGTQRDTVDAWFALLQELTDAAWGGSDPTPGLAKLAWWNEELRGWSKGARRHPLGEALQRLPAPWSGLAASLMALQQSRSAPEDAASAIAALNPFSAAVAECERALFGAAGDAIPMVANTLLAERLLADPDGATPLDFIRAEDREASARAWGERLLDGGSHAATRPRRIHAAIVKARLAQVVATGRQDPLTPWRALLVAWRAARKA